MNSTYKVAWIRFEIKI